MSYLAGAVDPTVLASKHLRGSAHVICDCYICRLRPEFAELSFAVGAVCFFVF